MKIKQILWLILYTLLITGGTLLCCFAEPLKNRIFNCVPMGIMLIVMGFLAWIFEFIDYIVDKINENKSKK